MKVAIKGLYFLSVITTIILTIHSIMLLNINNVQAYMLDALIASSVSLGFTVIIYSINHNLKHTITLFLYTLTFMCFNLGAYIFDSVRSYYGRYVFQEVSYISYKNEAYGIALIYIAMLSYFISYASCNRIKTKKIKDSAYNIELLLEKYKLTNLLRNLQYIKNINNMDNIVKVRNWCKYILFFCTVPAFIKVYLTINYSMKYGYVSLYLSQSYRNPLLDIFDTFYFISFCGYLATFPQKKESRPIFIVFVLYAFLTIMAGARSSLVSYLLILLWYFCKRDRLNIDEKIVISKRVILMIICVSFFAFIFLYQYGHYRSLSGFNLKFDSLFNDFVSFFSTQGGSGKLISLSIENLEKVKSLSPGAKTFFSPLISYWYGGGIGRLLGFGVPGQTVEHVYKIGGLGSVLTYIINIKSYLSGNAVGSNYIAELYVSFGGAGVIIYNIILGYIFTRMDNIERSKWRQSFVSLYLLNKFLLLPRASALGFVTGMIMILIFYFGILILTAFTFKDKKVV